MEGGYEGEEEGEGLEKGEDREKREKEEKCACIYCAEWFALSSMSPKRMKVRGVETLYFVCDGCRRVADAEALAAHEERRRAARMAKIKRRVQSVFLLPATIINYVLDTLFFTSYKVSSDDLAAIPKCVGCGHGLTRHMGCKSVTCVCGKEYDGSSFGGKGVPFIHDPNPNGADFFFSALMWTFMFIRIGQCVQFRNTSPSDRIIDLTNDGKLPYAHWEEGVRAEMDRPDVNSSVVDLEAAYVRVAYHTTEPSPYPIEERYKRIAFFVANGVPIETKDYYAFRMAVRHCDAALAHVLLEMAGDGTQRLPVPARIVTERFPCWRIHRSARMTATATAMGLLPIQVAVEDVAPCMEVMNAFIEYNATLLASDDDQTWYSQCLGLGTNTS